MDCSLRVPVILWPRLCRLSQRETPRAGDVWRANQHSYSHRLDSLSIFAKNQRGAGGQYT